jgi:hypothetical protein
MQSIFLQLYHLGNISSHEPYRWFTGAKKPLIKSILGIIFNTINIPIYYHEKFKTASTHLSRPDFHCHNRFDCTVILPHTRYWKFRDLSFSQIQSPNNLSHFIKMVTTSKNSNQVVGVYQQNVLTAPVVQQPSNLPGFVSTDADKVTQFRMANQFGVTALLAHNYLVGKNFSKITPGSLLTVVYGDGKTALFLVEEVREYQALSPNSPYSNFKYLADKSNKTISANDLFYDIYTQKGRLVLQTCIEKDGELSWGRLFIIASYVDPFSIAAIH